MPIYISDSWGRGFVDSALRAPAPVRGQPQAVAHRREPLPTSSTAHRSVWTMRYAHQPASGLLPTLRFPNHVFIDSPENRKPHDVAVFEAREKRGSARPARGRGAVLLSTGRQRRTVGNSIPFSLLEPRTPSASNAALPVRFLACEKMY
ncbi:conserved hypothetical protein [Xanthomonas citri pv. citri]|uniref:Uncharacterized protein n=1 Tax=Xanthomonas citri pv. citri TaxID=611301 RepID=A0A0U5FAQ4_XANCI|nr:conserved hypothetical protein [Xanthomonas citri pv. citri]CEE16468.1 conserved hypothetical protein [Xanthomonas citri pv. citri]CEE17917.1 conserved hypothetical protein [Xanthomonas citri pv. citri]CEE24799.1 conserved hypothetical protein [Xanthomonas citri pv. citri]CEE30552.1 conserved hypothetical protein [Xanthomonas citri pv. citri]